MEIKVLIDEKHKSTSIEYDETKHDKGTVCAFLISALFDRLKGTSFLIAFKGKSQRQPLDINEI